MLVHVVLDLVVHALVLECWVADQQQLRAAEVDGELEHKGHSEERLAGQVHPSQTSADSMVLGLCLPHI